MSAPGARACVGAVRGSVGGGGVRRRTREGVFRGVMMETTHSIVAGALYDFLGLLTADADAITVGRDEPPYLIIRKLETWASARGLDLSCADVHRWQQRLAIETPEIIASSAFVKELTSLLNRFSIENGSDTPDFILAGVLVNVLFSWNNGVMRREEWYGRPAKGGRAVGPVPGDLPTDPVPSA